MTVLIIHALDAFIACIGNELVPGRAFIRREGRGFELRHLEDQQAAPEELRSISLNEVGALAQFTASRTFRALKSAPSLQSGWWLTVRVEAELESTLNKFCPGAIADWFAANSPNPPVKNYPEFTTRQTGIDEVTSSLDDRRAALVIRNCCDAKSCRKRRLWTVAGLVPDATEEKSLIPCLEPCVVLLESGLQFARPTS